MLPFINNAMAAGGAAKTDGWTSFLMIIGFIGIVYFLLMRPQQKRQKQHQELIASVKKGDKVVTSSGIIATVSKAVSDNEVVLEIADGVYCKFVKTAIAHKLNNDIAMQPAGQPQQLAASKNLPKTSESKTSQTAKTQQPSKIQQANNTQHSNKRRTSSSAKSPVKKAKGKK
jgi:preprotein translocase subunit YajC